MPHLFFMAFAPLDVWARMLLCPLQRIRPRYWGRLAFYLLSSAIGTLISIPERLLYWLYDRIVPFRLERLPGPVFVLGYYRSGTTHLQYLLSCDPNLYTPRWYQALLPQGFVLSWTLLRLTIIGFTPNRRPMDDVGVGLEFPAEDQVGMLNWGLASTLPGRTVLPRAIPHYRRYQAPERLTPAEYRRWKRYQLAFIRKLTHLAGGRRLLLKSPSHTALVRELHAALAGAGPAKFIHISRHPREVVESNLKLHRRFYGLWRLQDAIDDATLLDYVVTDYLDAERRYMAARDAIGPEHFVEIRYEDLRADPVGTLRGAYVSLGLEFNEPFEKRLRRYLARLQNYRPGTDPAGTLPDRPESAQLDGLTTRFGHDRPATAAELSPTGGALDPNARTTVTAGAAALAAGIACAATWLLLAVYSNVPLAHLNRLVWPTGLAVGYAAWRTVETGSRTLGIWTAGVTLAGLMTVNVLFAAHQLVPAGGVSWTDWAGIMQTNLVNIQTAFWGVIGVLSAYRLGNSHALPWR